jgi:hypothetical protein
LTAIALLTDYRCSRSFDRVRREMDKTSASATGSRFRLEPFIALLLLFMFALSLHVQLAKIDNLSTLPGKHILHGISDPTVTSLGKASPMYTARQFWR